VAVEFLVGTHQAVVAVAVVVVAAEAAHPLPVEVQSVKETNKKCKYF
jgi:hypothetical protein